jgi:hypothetical protein
LSGKKLRTIHSEQKLRLIQAQLSFISMIAYFRAPRRKTSPVRLRPGTPPEKTRKKAGQNRRLIPVGDGPAETTGGFPNAAGSGKRWVKTRKDR